MTKFLIGLDGSDTAQRAFANSKALFKIGDHVRLVCIVPITGDAEQQDAFVKRAKEILAPFEKELKEAEIEHEAIVHTAKDGRKKLLDESQNVDFVILGKRGIGALKKLIMGSTTAYMTNQSKTPVIVMN